MLVSVCHPVSSRWSLTEHSLSKGGSFLYVATVLQPVPSGNTSASPHDDDISVKTRLAFIVWGMFSPPLLGAVVGHGHS